MKQEILRFTRVAVQPPLLPPLWDVTFSLYQGEAVLLTGLFQSGLRTLTALLEGELGSFSGTLRTPEQSYTSLNRDAAVTAGIAVIGHRSHFIENLPFTESLQLVMDPRRPMGLLHPFMLPEAAKELAQILQLDLANPGTTTFAKIKWEILAAFARGARLFWFVDFSEVASNEELLQLQDCFTFLKEHGRTLVMTTFQGALWWFAPVADRCLVMRHGMITMPLYRDEGEEFDSERLHHLIVGRRFAARRYTAYGADPASGRETSAFTLCANGGETVPLPKGRIIGLYDEASRVPTDAIGMMAALNPVLHLQKNGHPLSTGSFYALSRQKIALIGNGTADRLIMKNLSPCENSAFFAVHRLPDRWLYKPEVARYLFANTVARYPILKHCAELFDCGSCYALTDTDLFSLMLAKWLAANPQLLLWIAPLAQEDIKQTERLRDLRQTLRDEGRTSLIISSDYDYLENHCEEILDI